MFFDLVVESITKQSFVTRELIKKSYPLYSRDFPQNLKTKLRRRCLHINHEMKEDSLEILIKHGSIIGELLSPPCSTIAGEKIPAWTKLLNSYRYMCV